MDLAEPIRSFTEPLRQLDRESLTDEEREALRALYRQLVDLAAARLRAAVAGGTAW